MKKLSKIMSLLLAVAMVFAMAVTAMAEDDVGKITIENATNGKAYNAYKIFSATYAEGVGDDADHVSYTIKNTDKWWPLLITGGTTANGVITTDYFKFIPSAADKNVYVVNPVDGADIIGYLQGLVTSKDFTIAADYTVASAENNKVEWEVPYGYYLITSSLNTAVTVDTNTPSVTVIDKNMQPGVIDPDGDTGAQQAGKNVASEGAATGTAGTYGKVSYDTIGDTVYFKINAYAPLYDGADKVSKYTFVDNVPNGFTYSDDFAVKVRNFGETPWNNVTLGTDYVLTVNNNVLTLTVTIPETGYNVQNEIEITYTAKLNGNAAYDNANTVTISWEDAGQDTDHATNTVSSTTNTYTYGFNVQKYKESVAVENKMGGAEFKLYKEDGTTQIPVVNTANGEYRVALSTETGVVIKAGTAKIWGLEPGSYKLVETKAPEGYNILEAPENVEIIAVASDGKTVNVDAKGMVSATVGIVNNAGSKLPETGGIGTTIFYVVGGLMMVTAAVVLVTRKKMTGAQ